MKQTVLFILLFLLSQSALFAQKPEKQVSFAQSLKPHAYYVEQAKLWWEEIQKNDTSETNWYNYFRACRNVQGTDDWKTDFVKESPYLRQGDDIMKLIEEKIPNTFTYYYLSYLNHGVGTESGDKLLKAYRMNPNFEGIHSSVISYAASSFDFKLRKEVNQAWFKANYISPQLLYHAYNVLMSLDKNAVLLTQADNDTYPVWMLQDALGIRPDVLVLNIDFMIGDDYRARVLKELKLPALNMEVNLDEYRSNWKKTVQHIMGHYNFERPLYIGMTLFESLYEGYEDKLVVAGLAYKFTRKKEDLTALNEKLYEQTFDLDYLHNQFFVDQNQINIDYHNLSYLNFLKSVFDGYQAEKKSDKAAEVKALALLVAGRIGNDEFTASIKKAFP